MTDPYAYPPTDLRTGPITTVVGGPGPEPAPEPPPQGERYSDMRPVSVDSLRKDKEPTPWPDGAPELKPFLTMTRKERAKVIRYMAPLNAASERWNAEAEITPDGTKRMPMEMYAEMMDALGDIEELLIHVALDGERCRQWCAAASEDQLMLLFNAYSDRFQLGEAPRSAS